jgi:catechol 2,3-dioxygenase-like lactoylglutathione lyase family enzyme
MERPSLWVGHLVLAANDPVTLGAFYERLGLRVVERGVPTVLELRGGTHMVILKKPMGPPRAMFDLMVDDHDATHAAWRASGVDVSEISVDARNGHRIFTVTDPEGNAIVVNNTHVVGSV